MAAHETWNVGSCDDESGPGAGWAGLELGWAGAGLGWSWARLELGWVATVSTTMTYEGKILLNSKDNGVADFLRSRHNIDI